MDFEIVYMTRTVERISTLIKNKIKFSSSIRKFRGIGCNAKSYMTNDLLINGENICAFPHILGSPFSYMTLQLLHSEFPYIWEKFDFLFYQCTREKHSENPQKERCHSSYIQGVERTGDSPLPSAPASGEQGGLARPQLQATQTQQLPPLLRCRLSEAISILKDIGNAVE